MARVFMERGGEAHVSEEDREASRGWEDDEGRFHPFNWNEFRLKPSGRVTAWCRHQTNGRVFELFLHRLVAVRMDPGLAKRAFRATPIDGDYLNCRRENLEIAIRKPKRQGPSPKPGGYPVKGAARRRPRPGRASGDLASLFNPGKWLPTTRKLKPRRGSGGDGPAGGEVGGDPR